ncbi:MAG: tRNA pseudouridine(38-40) synthase TruA, partial [Clostridia bacterium]|nr:tRNA pseudouridine(38-40) synthase TruA [Clostridia bacterium]
LDMKYKVTVAYDGRQFCGFQFQPNLRTVQGTLTDAMRTVLGDDCTVTGCSRTDSGVHASGFVALVDAPHSTVPYGKLCRAVNCVLPDDVALLSSEMAPEGFHPRYSAKSKEYEYLINVSETRNPFSRGLVYDYCRELDAGKMCRAAADFAGEHDFSAFMSAGSDINDTVRTIFGCNVTRRENIVAINICGTGFLYNMVRIIAGTLVYVSEGKIPDNGIPCIIESGDRSLAGPTAPACGLYLKKVNY